MKLDRKLARIHFDLEALRPKLMEAFKAHSDPADRESAMLNGMESLRIALSELEDLRGDIAV